MGVVIANLAVLAAPFMAAGYATPIKAAALGCLLGAGALVFAVLILFGSVSTSNPNGTYEPAVYKDGKIVPGRIK